MIKDRFSMIAWEVFIKNKQTKKNQFTFQDEYFKQKKKQNTNTAELFCWSVKIV